MKPITTITALAAALTITASASVIATAPEAPVATTTRGGFETARRPITNPTLFDLALPTTNIHPIYIYHGLPNQVSIPGGTIPMGGNVQVYALQFEIAFTERLSLVATKDGYVQIDPKTTPLWSDKSGFANIAAGLKYAFILDPVNELAVSGTATIEFPTGNHDVFQGEGDGAINLIVSALKMVDDLQLAGGAGVKIPFDGQMATTSFMSGHISYEVVPWFIPLVELNWHHVLDAGNGRPSFFGQAGGAVPVVAAFEGHDLLNFGAVNAFHNRDLVTVAAGFRSRLSESVDVGFAYEFPITSREKGIIDERFTLDLIWTF
ncbi:hypothetical protein [Haloferula sp. A504]|uniref:hypothetical protein n=1 Tax=Haloferula sp. A504 TaxID=3373601 RepID=UPI0031C539C2|nr:hypothetical protein [Verrucomicrobiaceae bacterium E54]